MYITKNQWISGRESRTDRFGESRQCSRRKELAQSRQRKREGESRKSGLRKEGRERKRKQEEGSKLTTSVSVSALRNFLVKKSLSVEQLLSVEQSAEWTTDLLTSGTCGGHTCEQG